MKNPSTMHLIKLSVGPSSLAELAEWQKLRMEQQRAAGQPPELMHITRFMPKKAAEVLNGGSIYWVIQGTLLARQKLLELRPVVRDGTPACALVLAPELIRVSPRPQRPFQGWRYLDPQDAPRDLTGAAAEEEIPEQMLRELSELGLI